MKIVDNRKLCTLIPYIIMLILHNYEISRFDALLGYKIMLLVSTNKSLS